MEKRIVTEIRTQGRKLEGYAATFGNETRIANFTEVIRPGAFSRTIQGRDILALVDHDQTKVIARTKSGTLRLREDSHGLAFELDIPETQAGRDVLALAERGDLGGMSFGFTVPEDGELWTRNKRELLAVDLHEISVVSAWPAYDGTEVHARAKTPYLNRAKLYLETCV